LAEPYEADDALVEVDDDREKVKLALVETDCSESLDMCEIDRWRARASIEFCLVCEGDRLGIAGASEILGRTADLSDTMK
jgi:hypothetical protein